MPPTDAPPKRAQSPQPLRLLARHLATLATAERYLFTPDDLRALFPHLSAGAFKALLSRAVQSRYLVRLCRGLYLVEQVAYPRGMVLAHAAARMRADALCYVSLESALSDAGLISQVPQQWLSVMTTGRSGQIACGPWGTIEFVHTRQSPAAIADQLHFDARSRLWRASTQQALRDMRAARRPMDLVAMEDAHEEAPKEVPHV